MNWMNHLRIKTRLPGSSGALLPMMGGTRHLDDPVQGQKTPIGRCRIGGHTQSKFLPPSSA